MAQMTCVQALGEEVNVEERFPLLVTPRSQALADDPAAAAAWLAEYRDDVEELLVHFGAALLRGFAIRSTDDFANLVAHYPSPQNGYSGGATPRAAITGRVFEATKVPAPMHLMLHQEMAYLPNWPRKLAFYCKAAPESGGETIIGDVRRFEKMVDPALMAQVIERGVLYTRNFRAPGDFPAALESAHRTWHEAFYTDDPAVAENSIRGMGMEAQWMDDGSLTARYRASGFIDHPITGERRWFNHIASQTMTPQSLRDRWPIFAQTYAAGRPKPYDVRFGDGGQIPLDDVVALFPQLDEVTTANPWQAGDVLLIDNVQTFHGRNPYTGHRDVQVALIEEGVQ